MLRRGPTPESAHLAKESAPAASIAENRTSLAQVLLTIFVTFVTRHVQGPPSPSAHSPSDVVLYQAAGSTFWMTVSYEKNSNVGRKARSPRSESHLPAFEIGVPRDAIAHRILRQVLPADARAARLRSFSVAAVAHVPTPRTLSASGDDEGNAGASRAVRAIDCPVAVGVVDTLVAPAVRSEAAVDLDLELADDEVFADDFFVLTLEGAVTHRVEGALEREHERVHLKVEVTS